MDKVHESIKNLSIEKDCCSNLFKVARSDLFSYKKMSEKTSSKFEKCDFNLDKNGPQKV